MPARGRRPPHDDRNGCSTSRNRCSTSSETGVQLPPKTQGRPDTASTPWSSRRSCPTAVELGVQLRPVIAGHGAPVELAWSQATGSVSCARASLSCYIRNASPSIPGGRSRARPPCFSTLLVAARSWSAGRVPRFCPASPCRRALRPRTRSSCARVRRKRGRRGCGREARTCLVADHAGARQHEKGSRLQDRTAR